MPTITLRNPDGPDQTIACDRNANLREVLLLHGVNLYNGRAAIINCHGLGTCGTCAVKVEGSISPVNWRDKARRSLPPHSPDRDLRLACQTRVLGDISVTKFDGFWGQGDSAVAVAPQTPVE
ncbi:MAG: 2Fe-2S iron-sulfur cluster-binding protein [Elainellaceae cyanobacterium]